MERRSLKLGLEKVGGCAKDERIAVCVGHGPCGAVCFGEAIRLVIRNV